MVLPSRLSAVTFPSGELAAFFFKFALRLVAGQTGYLSGGLPAGVDARQAEL